VPSKRPCHQVVLRLLPGGEPWFRIETSGGGILRMPGTVSLLQLFERLSSPTSAQHTPEGELMVLVPVGDVLTVGGIRELHRKRSAQSD